MSPRGLAVSLALAFLVVGALPSGAQESRKARRVSVTDEGVKVQSVSGEDSVVSDDVIAGAKVRTEQDRHGFRIEVGDKSSGLVRLFSDASVPAGKVVAGDVVAVFGSVDVEGEVNGDVVAVMGRVRLHRGAIVEGDVVSVGGPLVQDDDVTVNGETVSVGLLPFSWSLPTLPILLIAIFCGWLLSVGFGWLFARLAPTRLLRVAVTCSRRTGASLLASLVAVPLLLLAIVLLFVTVIGIPLAFLLPVAFGFISFLGHLVAAYVVGCKLMRRRIGEGGLVTPLAVGNLFVALFLVVAAVLGMTSEAGRPAAVFLFLLGMVLMKGLTLIGTGAFLISRLGTRPLDVIWKGDVPLEPAARGVPLPAQPPAGI